MPRSGPRTVRRYSDEFKLTAVRLSQQPGIQVKTVAAALAIHPYMLSKWRKDAREGRLRGAAVTRPNQVWAGDITYLKVADGWRYLAIVMDQYSRRVLAWSLTRRRTAAVTCAVLARAARGRPARGVIFHSDRGSEYMGAPFCARAARLGLLQSASARGPGDNAHAESFFHYLKAELVRGTAFRTERALRAALRAYLGYYNAVRLHSSLNYAAPLAFERGAA
ncbi:MAG: IS3 family transposase [Gemmatimonadaceae bacterium]